MLQCVVNVPKNTHTARMEGSIFVYTGSSTPPIGRFQFTLVHISSYLMSLVAPPLPLIFHHLFTWE